MSAQSRESHGMVSLFDWTGGIRNRRHNPLKFPANALVDGENVDLTDGELRTRAGTSITSTDSLPKGEVMALHQVRFPTNEVSYLIAQVKHGAKWTKGEDMPSTCAKYGHSAVWDPESTRMLVFGGCDNTTFSNDLWSYDPSSDQWTQISPSGDLPAPRTEHCAIWDQETGRMIVFGGWDRATDYNDTWAFTPSGVNGGSWVELPTSGNLPEPRHSASAVHDPVNGTMLVMGGWSMTGGSALSVKMFHTLDLETNVWSYTTCTAPDPPYLFSRCNHVAVYDPDNRRIFVIGGDDGEQFYSDTWSLDISHAAWSMLCPVPLDQFGISRHAAVYCNGTILLTGGVGHSCFGSWEDHCLTYSIAENTWTRPYTTRVRQFGDAIPGHFFAA